MYYLTNTGQFMTVDFLLRTLLFAQIFGQYSGGSFKCLGEFALCCVADLGGNVGDAIIAFAKQCGSGAHTDGFHVTGDGLAVDGFEYALQRRAVNRITAGEHVDGDALVKMAQKFVVDLAYKFRLLGRKLRVAVFQRRVVCEEEQQLLQLELEIDTAQLFRSFAEWGEDAVEVGARRNSDEPTGIFPAQTANVERCFQKERRHCCAETVKIDADRQPAAITEREEHT